MISQLGVDATGLHTDRLLQIQLCAGEVQTEGLAVQVHKGRFSEERRRFIERVESIPGLDEILPAHHPVSLLTCGQVQDYDEGMPCTCFLVKEIRPAANGGSGRNRRRTPPQKSFTLRLCRLQEGERAPSGSTSTTASRHSISSEEVGETERLGKCDNFMLIDGPCILAWQQAAGKRSIEHAEVLCWYKGRWSRYDLGLPEAQHITWGGVSQNLSAMLGDQTAVTFRCLHHSDGDEPSFSWRVLEVPQASDTTSNGNDTCPTVPYCLLLAKLIAKCTCFCESALTWSPSRQEAAIYVGTNDHRIVVSEEGNEICSLNDLPGPPTSISIFLPEGGDEHIVVTYDVDSSPVKQCHLVRRDAKGGLSLLRAFSAIGHVLRGDFLGNGWDQIALVQQQTKDQQKPQEGDEEHQQQPLGNLINRIIVTDGSSLWITKQCYKLTEVPHELDRVDSSSTDRKKKKRPLVIADTENGTGHHQRGQVDGHTSAAAAAAGVTTEEAQRREHLLGNIRLALASRLKSQEARWEALTKELRERQQLLAESQQVLASFAYQEVFPCRTMNIDEDCFARPLLPVCADTEDSTTAGSSTTAAVPRFPIVSHRLTKSFNPNSGEVSLRVVLRADKVSRLAQASLASFSLHGHIPFTSAMCPVLEPDQDTEFFASIQVSSELLDPLTQTVKIVVCCSWQMIVSIETDDGGSRLVGGGGPWCAGSQTLEHFELTAQDLSPSMHWLSSSTCPPSMSLTRGGEGNTNKAFFWWKTKLGISCLNVESAQRLEGKIRSQGQMGCIRLLEGARTSTRGRERREALSMNATQKRGGTTTATTTVVQCEVAAKDAPSLCSTLHSFLQGLLGLGEEVQAVGPLELMMSQTPDSSKLLVDNMSNLLSLLQRELDLLCTLAEGKQPEEQLVREVWLSQPSLDLSIHALGLMT